MHNFIYVSQPSRVIFGHGTIETLPFEVERLGLKRVLFVATERQAPAITELASKLGSRAAAIFAGAVMHTPTSVTDKAMAVVNDNDIDGIVAMGGGSSIGLSKAIALRTDFPQIVIPTTYAGSEMTPILGETEDGIKITQKSERVLPETVIYDIDLTLSLPAQVSIVSGMNAIAHAAEALYAQDRNPVVSLLAAEAIKVMARSLPVIKEDITNRRARSDALYSAWLCGIALGSVGMSLHHKLCHTLGGSFNLPHAETHAAILPHVVAYNFNAAPEAFATIAKALGVTDASRGLYDLARSLGAEMALGNLGLKAGDLDKVVELSMSKAYWNPERLQQNALKGLVQRAYEGLPPVRPVARTWVYLPDRRSESGIRLLSHQCVFSDYRSFDN